MNYPVEYLDIDSIKPYRGNAKKHPPEQIDQIARSIQEFGWQQNLVIDSKNVLVIGHGRWLAARKLGLKRVPCMRSDNLTPQQLKALRLADNRVGESGWDEDFLKMELDNITDIDMEDFGFEQPSYEDEEEEEGPVYRSSLQHNVFENQEVMQFPSDNFFGIPSINPTQTVGNKLLRFCDFKDVNDHESYICHFYYDDYKFMSAWREPDKYLSKLRKFKAVISPNFSLYTDFPRALQILAVYRRQWCSAYWQSLGIDVIPCAMWGDKKSYDYCFLGMPKKSVVSVSTVGVSNDLEWNGREGEMFRDGYNEMLRRLEPTKIIFYGTMPAGLEGDIVHAPTFYEQRRQMLNEKRKQKREILTQK